MADFNSTQPVSDPILFVGRQQLIESLRDHVRSTVFIGEARIGKTSLLLQLKSILTGVGHKMAPRLPIYINFRNPRFREPRDVYQAIASYVIGEIRRVMDLQVPEFEGPHFDSAWLLRFLEQLETRGLHFAIVLLADNLDRPEAFLSQRLTLYSGLRQILDFSPNGFSLKLVATASAEFLTLETSITSKLLSRLQVVSLEALSLEETRRLISNSALIEAAPQSGILKDYLFEQCGGHPSLLQEVLANISRRGVDESKLREILERECDELVERGGNFFEQYMSELAYQDVIYLLAIALQAGDQEWRPPQTVVKRFIAAGLVREGPEGVPEASCRLFFKWFRRNVTRISPGFSQAVPPMMDFDALIELLQTKVRLSVGNTKVLSEKLLQDIVNIMFIAVDCNVEREVTFYYKDKAYRSDFTVPDLRTAIEIKLAKSQNQIGRIVDELEADLGAYQSHYRYLLVLIYDLINSSRLENYIAASENPFVHYILIRH